MKTVLAFDFGASTGRAIKATYNNEDLTYEEIHRFDNIPKIVDGHVCHDVDMIVANIKEAITKAGEIDSLAFDTWGVDYGLLDKDGNLIHLPYHYRDERTSNALDKAFEKIDADDLYQETGNQTIILKMLISFCLCLIYLAICSPAKRIVK